METRFFRYAWMESRRDQLVVLAFVVASLPFYWWSLEVPKRIVNDAIQGRAFRDGATEARLFEIAFHLPEGLGGGEVRLFDGLMLPQVQFLFALSGLFLALVLINGAFKYVINIQKGVLGERMLRRLRFQLFDLVMRFRPEDARTAKPAEVASMIKDEVEPIGTFFGEAFITPAFLTSQAITAMAFIMAQNVWLGLVAAAVVGVQGLVIPRLRREQVRLGRERQIASRALAGRVGEMVDVAPAIHSFGGGAYARAEIGDRLGRLFDIRFTLYRRKFAVKYLNNLLAQVTPFVFYTIGGYLALKGRLDIGQLVAIIAAYRDLPTPIKELIDWDQQRADVTVKYEQVVSQFAKDVLIPADDAAQPPVPADAPIELTGVRVLDTRGTVLLERTSLTIDRPSHVALVGQGGGREAFARVLGRQISDHQGIVRVDGRDFAQLPDATACGVVAYVGADPHVVSGSIRDNLLFALRCAEPPELRAPASREEERRRAEALRTGNPPVGEDAAWLAEDVAAGDDGRLIEALKIAGGANAVAALGLAGRIGADLDAETAGRVVAARRAIREALAAKGQARLVEPFEPEKFNASATLGENLIFGVVAADRLSSDRLATDPYLRSILDAEALTEPLVEVGARIAETVVEAFPGLEPGHPLIARYAFVDPADIPDLARMLGTARRVGGSRRFPLAARNQLIGFALDYIEARHRLDAASPDLVSRILRARESFRRFVPAAYADVIEFYDPERVVANASITDNILFGRIPYGAAQSRKGVEADLRATLDQFGLEPFVYRRGLDQPAGPGGRLLPHTLRMSLQIARAVLRRPQTLVVDGAFTGFAPEEAAAILAALKKASTGRSLIVALPASASEAEWDRVLSFEGTRLTGDRDQRSSGLPDAFAGREREGKVALVSQGAGG